MFGKRPPGSPDGSRTFGAAPSGAPEAASVAVRERPKPAAPRPATPLRHQPLPRGLQAR